ncbi:hypothetical protein N7520_010623 [Penicillium odoratum]|uniref:uncharacterized protein n=1 Tax=Penicillium odoratum TaxID=1167516 RepID=UPI00254927CE|nr:uncharacterized protein N7520_010623 [Penicillium odoratum]KAJ5745441.1 hypothetical protein N7520_010623 [Penicillium odoratum]
MEKTVPAAETQAFHAIVLVDLVELLVKARLNLPEDEDDDDRQASEEAMEGCVRKYQEFLRSGKSTRMTEICNLA